MQKQRWFIDQKKQHVASWRASGLTRRQYCELNDIPFTSFREWPQDVAKAQRRASKPTVLPVHIVGSAPPYLWFWPCAGGRPVAGSHSDRPARGTLS